MNACPRVLTGRFVWVCVSTDGCPGGHHYYRASRR